MDASDGTRSGTAETVTLKSSSLVLTLT